MVRVCTEGVRGGTLRRRGQAAVLGLAFIVGFVAVVSVGIFLVAGQTSSELEHRAEKDRVEGAFVELGTELETASSSEDVARAMDLPLYEYHDDLRFEDAGRITVTVDNDTVYDRSLGSIEYVASDGTRIVYQAGGVWRVDGASTETGTGFRTVSEPNVHVRDGTISFPVAVLDGGEGLDDGTLSMTARHRRSLHSSLVRDDVVLNVTTQYHEWWEAYFRTRLGDDAVSVTESGSPDEKTVSVRLEGRADREADFVVERGITVEDRFDSGGGASGSTIASDVGAREIKCGAGLERYNGTPSTVSCVGRLEDGYEATLDDLSGIGSVDSLVSFMANTSETDLGPIELTAADEPLTLTAGHYYTDRVELDNDLVVDLSDGDVSLVVGEDGFTGSNPHYADGIVVENVTADHTFRMYNTGDLDLTGQWNVCATACNGTDTGAIEYYGHSGTTVDIGNDRTVFEGVVIAPESAIVFSGADFHGALVGENVDMKSPETTFRYDDSLAGKRFFFDDRTLEDGESYYLNVVVTEVSVRSD